MENTKIKINLNSIDKIKRFGQVVRGFMSDVNIMTATNGKYLDAKSLFGLFNMDLCNDTYVDIKSDNIDEIRHFDAAMEEFR